MDADAEARSPWRRVRGARSRRRRCTTTTTVFRSGIPSNRWSAAAKGEVALPLASSRAADTPATALGVVDPPDLPLPLLHLPPRPQRRVGDKRSTTMTVPDRWGLGGGSSSDLWVARREPQIQHGWRQIQLGGVDRLLPASLLHLLVLLLCFTQRCV